MCVLLCLPVSVDVYVAMRVIHATKEAKCLQNWPNVPPKAPCKRYFCRLMSFLKL